MNEQRHWFVYRHVNKINGKMYFGITGTSPHHRWGQGYKGSTRFYNAIQKYGWDNFEHQILLSGLTKQQAELYEIFFIRAFQTQDDRYGYNIMSGGHAPHLSEETKKKISEANKGHGDRGGGAERRRVLCVETGQIFPSVSSAARWCKSNSSHISYCCSGKLKSVKGYHFQYA